MNSAERSAVRIDVLDNDGGIFCKLLPIAYDSQLPGYGSGQFQRVIQKRFTTPREKRLGRTHASALASCQNECGYIVHLVIIPCVAAWLATPKTAHFAGEACYPSVRTSVPTQEGVVVSTITFGKSWQARRNLARAFSVPYDLVRICHQAMAPIP